MPDALVYVKLEVVQGSKTRYLFHATPTKDALWYPLQKIFWFCSKFDHKLLGTYTNLVQAVLTLAADRTSSCPGSLSLTLFKKVFQNVKLDLFRHRLMVLLHEENMTTKKNEWHLISMSQVFTGWNFCRFKRNEESDAEHCTSKTW